MRFCTTWRNETRKVRQNEHKNVKSIPDIFFFALRCSDAVDIDPRHYLIDRTVTKDFNTFWQNYSWHSWPSISRQSVSALRLHARARTQQQQNVVATRNTILRREHPPLAPASGAYLSLSTPSPSADRLTCCAQQAAPSILTQCTTWRKTRWYRGGNTGIPPKTNFLQQNPYNKTPYDKMTLM